MYVPLHVHTSDGSMGDSILKPGEYISRARELGLSHLAITDHGSLSASYRFYHDCRKAGIEPIIGLEAYEVDDRLEKNGRGYYHLVLLAHNETGFYNLLKISNDAHLQGFYYKPRTDPSVLERYGEGIIALSGCVAGRIPQLILQEEDADDWTEFYQHAFDEFYLEIQPGDFLEQRTANAGLIELAYRKGVPLVATNDIHYLGPEDGHIHDAHVKIAQKRRLSDPMIYPDTCYWFMDENSLRRALSDLPEDVVDESIKNTEEIAARCLLRLPDTGVQMPHFETETGRPEEEELAQLCFDKLEQIVDRIKDPAGYADRLRKELQVINKLGYAGYFLMVRDFVQSALERDIPVGPGRGSAGGSLVSFLLGITSADPVRYELMFERFLSEHRKSIPDIDLDFCSLKRDRVFYYAVERYGAEYCSLISTRQIRKARGAIRDTARILDIDPGTADRIAKLIPQVHYDEDGEKSQDLSIGESLQVVPELRGFCDRFPELFEVASKLENLPSNPSIHAAGMLISPEKLDEYLPLRRCDKEGLIATELNLEDSELARAVKFDFLGLANMSIIENTKQEVGIEFDFLSDRFDDEKTWDLIGSEYTTGLFQVGTPTYKVRMPRLRPRSIPELANCLALVRGPCISSGADRLYMDIQAGKKKPDYPHSIYKKITRDTKGIIIYQEQIMELAVELGFSKEEGYNLLKAVSKKKLEQIAEFKEEFLAKAKKKGVSSGAAKKMWKTVEDAGLYSFNKSHATCYALVSYASAYLKAHYPLQFIKNLLNDTYSRKKQDTKEKVADIARDCKRLGIEFLPLDINKSDWHFQVENGRIRMGFCAVKGFGEKAAREVVQGQPYSDLYDFIQRVPRSKCDRKKVTLGIFAGLFSRFTESRLLVYNMYMDAIQEEPQETIALSGGDKFSVHEPERRLDLILTGATFPVVDEYEFIIDL